MGATPPHGSSDTKRVGDTKKKDVDGSAKKVVENTHKKEKEKRDAVKKHDKQEKRPDNTDPPMEHEKSRRKEEKAKDRGKGDDEKHLVKVVKSKVSACSLGTLIKVTLVSRTFTLVVLNIRFKRLHKYSEAAGFADGLKSF